VVAIDNFILLKKSVKDYLVFPDPHVSLPQYKSIPFLWFSPVCWYMVCLRKIISEVKAYGITSQPGQQHLQPFLTKSRENATFFIFCKP